MGCRHPSPVVASLLLVGIHFQCRGKELCIRVFVLLGTVYQAVKLFVKVVELEPGRVLMNQFILFLFVGLY